MFPDVQLINQHNNHKNFVQRILQFFHRLFYHHIPSLMSQTVLLQLQSFNGLFSRTTWVSRYQKGKTNLDFTGARDSEWQWHHLGHMHVCTSLQTDNHASTPPLCFLQAGCPSCRPTNSVKALKATCHRQYNNNNDRLTAFDPGQPG